MGAFHRVGQLEDFKDGIATACQVEGTSLVLCRSGDSVYAFEARCSHAFQPLEGARIRGETLMCPHHGARFDLRTGKNVAAPAVRGIVSYKVRQTGEKIDVFIEKDDAA